MNLKHLPVLINRALLQKKISDYHVCHTHNFCEMVYGRGGFSDANFCQRLIENLQELAGFEEGELICAWAGGFAAVGKTCTWGTANWKIIDAKQGVVDCGSVSVEMAQMVSKLPSACHQAEGLLDSNRVKCAHSNGGANWACCPC